jgi:hypothetical protein
MIIDLFFLFHQPSAQISPTIKAEKSFSAEGLADGQ